MQHSISANDNMQAGNWSMPLTCTTVLQMPSRIAQSPDQSQNKRLGI
jgi:hypothetical protein